MMRTCLVLLLASSSLIVAGCGPSGEEELRVWMAEQRASTKPSIQPLTEPKKFNPEPYTQDGSLLAKPELSEITASTVALTQRDQRRVSSFNLRFQLVRASDAQKSIAAAFGTASSPGGK